MMMSRVSDVTRLVSFLEKAYLMVSKGYGFPAITSPRVWGPRGFKGVFEVMNEELKKSGFRPLSWEEFKELLKKFDTPRWFGIVHVMYAMGKTNRIEPIVITIYRRLKF